MNQVTPVLFNQGDWSAIALPSDAGCLIARKSRALVSIYQTANWLQQQLPADQWRIGKESEAKKIEKPTMRGPLNYNARRYTILAEKLEAARRER